MEWLTVKQIADKFKVDAKTITRNWKAHKQFIKSRQVGNGPLEISSESIQVIKDIRRLYGQRYTQNKINEELGKSYQEYITVGEESSNISAVHRDTQGTSITENSLYDDMMKRFQEMEDERNRLLELLAKKDDESREEREEFRKERKMYLEREQRRDRQIEKLTESVLEMAGKMSKPPEHPAYNQPKEEEVPIKPPPVQEEPKSVTVEPTKPKSRREAHQNKSFWGSIWSIFSKRG